MENNNSSNGISAASLLGVALIILKLTGFIDWSWWYVTMPFWIGIPILLSGLLIVLIYVYFKK